MEGAEAGSGQAALDAAVQSAAADVAVQLGPALLYTLLHGNGNKESCTRIDTLESARDGHFMSYFFAHVRVGDGSADFRPLEEDPRGVFSH